MSLTKDDLKAIKNIVDTSVNTAVDGLALQTAAGFSEVHDKIDEATTKLGNKIDRLERVVTAEVQRTDKQSGAINRIRKQLRAV